MVTRCRLCVLPDTRPDTQFIDGICSACVSYAKRKGADWAARERSLHELLDSHHGECIVASSGGKDSTWQTLKLLEVGAHVTCATATTCHLTEVGRKNLDNLARYATTIEVSPNKTVRAKLNRLGLTLVGDISWPEHVSIFTVPFRLASDLGRGVIFYGENPQEAYGGPQGTDAAFELTPRWRSEFGGFLGLRPADMVGQDGITGRDMIDYTLPFNEHNDVKAYFLGQFYEWDSHRNARVAKEHGMIQFLPTQANWWDHENLDCTFTAFHDDLMWRKYGFGRAAQQLSVDIRSGLIPREAALVELEKRDGRLFDTYAGENVWKALDSIGVSRWQYFDIAKRFTAECSPNE